MKGFILPNILVALIFQISPTLAQTPCPVAVKTSLLGTTCTPQAKPQANPSSTTSYYFCAPTSLGSNPSYQWVLAYCLTGTFNPTTGQCPPIPTTNIVTSTTIAPSASTTIADPVIPTTANCTGSNNGATFALPNTNTAFYICVNGQAQTAQCSPNTYYNSAYGSCISSNTNTNNNNGLCPPGVTTLMASPNNCQSYVSCVNGQGTPYLCPYGLYFDPSMGGCTRNIPVSCYYNSNNNNNFIPVIYPNNKNNLGTNYGTDTFPIYQASCYPDCEVNNINNNIPIYYPNNNYPNNNYPNNYYPNNYYPNNYYPNNNYPNNNYPSNYYPNNYNPNNYYPNNYYPSNDYPSNYYPNIPVYGRKGKNEE